MAIPSLHALASRLCWLISPLVLLGAWQGAVEAGLFPRQLLVPPLQVWRTFTLLLGNGELVEHLLTSLARLGWGLGMGVSGGLLLGGLMGLSKTVEAYCGPLFHCLRQIPSLALIPLLVLMLGIDEMFKIVIVAEAAFFPMALATSQGIKGIARSYFEVAAVYRLPWFSLVRNVVLPAVTAQLVTGLRIGLTRAWVVLIAAELLAADSGLGQMIEMARQMLRIDVVMVGIVVTGGVGFALDCSLRQLERRLQHWQPPRVAA